MKARATWFQKRATVAFVGDEVLWLEHAPCEAASYLLQACHDWMFSEAMCCECEAAKHARVRVCSESGSRCYTAQGEQ